MSSQKTKWVFKRWNTNDSEHFLLLNIYHKRNRNWNYFEISSYLSQNGQDQKPNVSRCWCRHDKRRDLLAVWWGWKLIQPLWKALWRFFKILEIDHMIQVCHSWAYMQKTQWNIIQQERKVKLFLFVFNFLFILLYHVSQCHSSPGPLYLPSALLTPPPSNKMKLKRKQEK